jgi:hypothetical protein
MIEHLQESRGPAFGFAVRGKLTAEDTTGLLSKLDTMIGDYKKPIGVLADLTRMEGADWTARWNEMRFLERHTSQIARLAIVGATIGKRSPAWSSLQPPPFKLRHVTTSPPNSPTHGIG